MTHNGIYPVCDSHYKNMLSSNQEPKARIYDNDDCTGGWGYKQLIPNKTYYVNDLKNMKAHDKINTVILPPHLKGKASKNSNWGGGVVYFNPGVTNLKKTSIGNNEISNIKTWASKDWSRHLEDCCLGKGDNNKCGPFLGSSDGGSVACDSIIHNMCSKSYNKNKPECACFNSTIANKLKQAARCVILNAKHQPHIKPSL